MSKQPLKSLRIKEFRGSTKDFSISFDGKKHFSLIYGENGTGKTTICDAFDFIGNAKVGSLEYRGLGALSPFWATIGKQKSDILIELTTDSKTWNAQASTKAVTLIPGILPLKIEVLRRATLLKLVQDAPSEKYGAIKPFIDIDVLEQAETVLRGLVKEKRQVENEVINRIAENRQSLGILKQQTNAITISVIEWAKSEIAEAPIDQTKNINFLRGAAIAIDAVSNLKDEESIAIAALKKAEVSFHDANDSLTKFNVNLDSADADLIEILQIAQSHFSTHSVGDICPLCESTEKVDGLSDRINERLSKLKDLEDSRHAVQIAAAVVQRCKLSLNNIQERCKNLAKVAVAKFNLCDELWRNTHINVKSQLSNIEFTSSTQNIDIQSFSNAFEAANQLCRQMESKADNYNTTKGLYEQYEANCARQSELAVIIPRLEAALKICETQRKIFLDGLLQSIAQEVGRLYEKIHPGEGLNKISLKLDPQKKGSLDLSADFLSQQNQPPHAYFSESHLDSLGLCIFLALAGRQSPESTVLVMDDVLGSIDEPHVDRLIEMLYDESDRFKHTIVTTHYRPWKEKFRWGWLRNSQVELIELKNWNPHDGINLGSLSQAPLIELRNHLSQNPISEQAICASAGVLLEAVCDYLTLLYECAVPRRKGKFTLGDLLPNINGKLKDALKVEVKQVDGGYKTFQLSDKLYQLQQMAQLRNIFGCHYNDLSQHLNGSEALQFGTMVHDLATIIICDEEGWPGSDKSGSYWATRAETRRLHPLKKPK
jgi:energy-coupling factor transporter ATP-binding protein EcfA2